MINNIYSRSPYLIRIGVTASQTASKLELFMWKKGEIEPATASYTFTKTAPSPTQIDNIYDIAPYIRENITNSHIGIQAWDENAFSVADNWCNVRVKTYYATASSFTQSTDTFYTATNGYTTYQQGINAQPDLYPYYTMPNGGSNDYVQLLYNPNCNIINDTNIFDGSFISFLLEYTGTASYYTVDYLLQPSGATAYSYPITAGTGTPEGYALTATGSYLINVPLIEGLDGNAYTIYLGKKLYSDNSTVYSQYIGTYILFTECKYNPVRVSYVGQAGGIEFITFFKAKEENINITSTEYSRYNKFTYVGTSYLQYNTLDGQTNDFNVNGTRTIKLNTGWVDENYKNKIQDLMLSENIVLYDLVSYYRVQLKSKSVKLQSNLNDKNINYTIEFDFSSNIINNVI